MEVKEFQKYVENIDAWIKQIRADTSRMTDVSGITEENVNNIQHNYELVCELKDEIADLKNELNMMKVLQIASFKEKAKH